MRDIHRQTVRRLPRYLMRCNQTDSWDAWDTSYRLSICSCQQAVCLSDRLAGRLDLVSSAIQVGQQLVIWKSVKQMEKTCIVKARATVGRARVPRQQPETWQNALRLRLQGQSRPALNTHSSPSVSNCWPSGEGILGCFQVGNWVLGECCNKGTVKPFVLASHSPFLAFLAVSWQR